MKKLTKTVSVLLAVVMLMSIVLCAPFTVSAAETESEVAGGERSGDFEYEILYDGTAEITGYTGSAKELEIPGELDGYTVTSIGDWAFDFWTSLTSVTIPDSVTSIGDWAFYHCISLTGITIPDSVTSIGYGAFEDCTSLTSVIIPDSVTSIDNYAFSGCTSLTSIIIPESVT